MLKLTLTRTQGEWRVHEPGARHPGAWTRPGAPPSQRLQPLCRLAAPSCCLSSEVGWEKRCIQHWLQKTLLHSARWAGRSTATAGQL